LVAVVSEQAAAATATVSTRVQRLRMIGSPWCDQSA
jgi:hypothetical protein